MVDRQASLVGWVAAILLTGAFVVRGTLPGAGERVPGVPVTARASTAEVARVVPRGADELLGRALGLDPEDFQPQADLIGEGAAYPLVSTELARQGACVDVVIATVPDAVDSNIRWQFDGIVDALHRGIVADGFTLELFYIPDWVPWVDPEQVAGPRDQHERHPGWIAFSKVRDLKGREPRREYLLLALVSETPTSGVHAVALDAALRASQRWAGQACSAGPLRVVGPTFSGTIPTLARGLERRLSAREQCFDRTDAVQARVYSGSATNPKNGPRMRERLGHCVDYRAAVVPDDEVIRTLEGYFDRLGLKPCDIALLVENTAYGRGGVGDAGRPTECRRWREVSFPLHISRLRAANVPLTLAPTDTMRRIVGLTLDEPLVPTDSLPSMSPRLTAAAAELSLTNTLRMLRRERVRAVGLMATDTRDKLFLARMISDAVPSALLFTLEGDLLLAHPDYRRFARGMLVAGTYLLYPLPAARSGPQADQFQTSGAQGAYNAMRAQLDQRAPLQGYVPREAGAAAPAVWLGTVGPAGIWPLRLDTTMEPSAYTLSSAIPPQVVPLSAGTAVVWGSLAVAAALLLLTFRGVAAPPGVRRPGDSPDPDRAVADSWALERAEQDRRYLLAIAGGLGVVHVALTVCHGLAWWTRPQLLTGTLAAMGIATTGVAFVRLLTRAPAAYSRGLGSPSVSFVTTVLAGAAALLALAYLFGTVLDPATHIAFVERSYSITSGQSPLVATLALSMPVVLWALVHRHRLAMSLASVVEPSLKLMGWMAVTRSSHEVALGWVSRRHELASMLMWPARYMPRTAVTLCATTALVILMAAWVTRPLSFEGPAFTLFVIVAWTLTQWLLVTSVAQIWALWVATRALLDRLNAGPLAEAFRRDRNWMGDRLWPQRIEAQDLERAFELRRRLVDRLTQLVAGEPERDGDIHRAIAALGGDSDDVKTFDQVFTWDKDSSWRRLCQISRRLAQVVRHEAALDGCRGSGQDWLDSARDFSALPMALFVRELLARLVNVLYFLLGALVLMMLASSALVVTPRHVLSVPVWAGAGLVMFVSLRIVVEMERHPLLSRLSATPEHKVSWDGKFLRQVLAFGVAPVVSLIATQFPDLGPGLIEFIKPIERLLP